MLLPEDLAGGAPPDPAPAAPEGEGGLPPNNPEGEGTTPKEVAQVLKSSGINLPVDDGEEGDDPDVPEGDESDAPDTPEATPEGDEDADADEEEPEPAKPQRQAPEDLTTDEEKYSFEVTDANNVTFKIAVGAKMEDILAEFEPKNNGQILDILNQLQKLEGQKTADEAKAQEDQANTAQQERTQEYLKAWDGEAKDLQSQKRIAEGEDGTKRINEVYKFMADENDKRIKANKPTLQSFEDALDKLEAKETREANVEQDKKDKEEARKNGAKVGGSSAPASSTIPVYKGGSKNANQALRAMGLLK